MNRRFVLFYTGAPRHSGINNWEVFKHHIDGDKHVIHNFAEIARIAQGCASALARQKWDDVERLITKSGSCGAPMPPASHSAHRQTD